MSAGEVATLRESEVAHWDAEAGSGIALAEASFFGRHAGRAVLASVP